MKKYIENLFLVLFALLVFTACSDEQGTDAGNDSQPKVSLYKYAAAPPADSDNDIVLRVAANNKTDEAYYLVEKKADKDARGMTEAEYNDFVVANGTRINGIPSNSYADVDVSGLYGDCVITVVAVGGGKKVASTLNFLGKEWNLVAEGTYEFSSTSQARMPGCPATKEVELLVCTTDDTAYKIKDLYGTGYSLWFTKTTDTDKVDGEVVTFVRVGVTNTPYVYREDGGTVYLRDVATALNNVAYATHLSYGCYIFPDNSVYFNYRLADNLSNIAYAWDEWFIPKPVN